MNVFKSTPEIQFVLLCSSIDPDEERCARIRRAFCSSLDWERIYLFSLHHRLLPIVYLCIKRAIPDLIPREFFLKFKSAYVSNSHRNFSLTSFLLSILSLLNKYKIKVLPFKGLILAQDIYGDPNLRIFSDLDILISPDDAVEVCHLLTEKNFLPEIFLNDKQKEKYIKTEDHLVFIHKKSGAIIELHWEMSGRYISPFLGLDKVQDYLRPLPILNTAVLNLAPEALVVYLCIHGTKESWWNLEQIFSISQLIKKQKNLDWQLIKRLARRWRCLKMLDLGLFLTSQIFSTPVPESFILRGKKDRSIRQISKRILNRFIQETSSGASHVPGRFSSLHLIVRDSFAEKLSYTVKLIFLPSIKEWIHFPLPARISFLHYGLRPLRLFKEGLMSKHA